MESCLGDLRLREIEMLRLLAAARATATSPTPCASASALWPRTYATSSIRPAAPTAPRPLPALYARAWWRCRRATDLAGLTLSSSTVPTPCASRSSSGYGPSSPTRRWTSSSTLGGRSACAPPTYMLMSRTGSCGCSSTHHSSSRRTTCANSSPRFANRDRRNGAVYASMRNRGIEASF
jgi:hypothetical protein